MPQDPATGRTYYYHLETHERSWDPPPPPGDACGLELVATRLLRMSWSDVPARFYCCKQRP